jgi:hypothetical protein
VTFQDLGSVGEFVAAIATLATLVYLAAQIRQNTKAVKASSHHAITDSFNHINSIVGTDRSAARVMRIGMLDLDNLDEDEAFSFSYLMLAYLRIFETLYYQRMNGTMEDQLFRSEKRSLVEAFSHKGARDWWNSNPISFSEEFRAYIASVIEEIERDA